MNHPATDNRIRPGILVLVVCALAAILIPFWFWGIPKNEPAVAEDEIGVRVTAKPVVNIEAGPPEATAEPVVATNTPAPGLSAAVEEKWGIQVSSIRLMKSDSAVDVRYKVVAPEKVVLLASDKDRAYIIDQSSGAKFQMLAPPEGGTSPTNLRSRSVANMQRFTGVFPPPAGRLAAGGLYSLLLPNWGGALKSGSKVVLVVGDLQTEALTVE